MKSSKEAVVTHKGAVNNSNRFGTTSGILDEMVYMVQSTIATIHSEY